MRLHRVTLGLAVAALLTVGGASAAWADSPVDLGSQQLVDSAGVLSTSSGDRPSGTRSSPTTTRRAPTCGWCS